jgi:hypothetical protein
MEVSRLSRVRRIVPGRVSAKESEYLFAEIIGVLEEEPVPAVGVEDDLCVGHRCAIE